MPVLKNIRTLATCRREGGQAAIHEIRQAALEWEKDIIVWVGEEKDLPQRVRFDQTYDAHDSLVVPGLIDCHTHLVFCGWRADEFEKRIQGVDYLEIARTGGGIVKTVRQTRACTEDQLFDRSRSFLKEMGKLGVTTVEGKSGYGLTVDDEMKLLRVYARLSTLHHQQIVPTFLGAHGIPLEYRDDRSAYVRLVCEHMIPRVAREGLAHFCDVFVEETAFSREEAREILHTAKTYGLRPKLHADQLSDGQGAALAAEMEATSADHLEYASDEGIAALSGSGVVAVSLPIATLYLHQQPFPARKFINAGVRVAVATDFNPGTAPTFHLPLAMMLACTMQRMTPAEVLKGVTLYAADAVDLGDQVGSLEPGKRADFVVIDAPDVNHWLYHFRPNSTLETFMGGVPLSENS